MGIFETREEKRRKIWLVNDNSESSGGCTGKYPSIQVGGWWNRLDSRNSESPPYYPAGNPAAR